MTIAVLFVFSIFGAQLLRLQGFDASAVSKDAQSSRTATVALPAMRGSITDRNGTILASSIERRTVTVDQTAVPQYVKTVNGVRVKVGVAGAAQDLSPLLGIPVATLTPELTGRARYRVLQKNVTPLNWRKISELGVNGIYSEATSDRVYPTATAASALVGFLQSDGTAGSGIEVLMDKTLKGKSGKTIYEQSQDGRPIPNAPQETINPQPGHDVRLTIDSDLQWFAQNAVAQKVIQTQALSGTVVVENAKTGELLAVASYPTFDPNQPGQSIDNWTNKAFNDVYEPGSTGKVMTAAAAIQEGVVTPSTVVEVPNRIHRADNREFRDSHDHPTEYLTFAGVLAQSSNIGTILAGEKVKPATMYDYFRKFGLGQTSGMGFPGEGPGLLSNVNSWSGSQRYTVLFGQGLSVNALQAAGVFQTIANDGVRIPPRIIAGVGDGSGGFTPAPKASPITVVSPDTAQKVRDMLEGVVTKEGTAPQAKIAGYRVAGKTGTADRYDAAQGRYSGKTASFIGFAPADDPQIVVAVTIQRPIKGYFGGVVAGPVFHDIMTYALQELQIPPTGTSSPVAKLSPATIPAASDPSVIRDRRSGASGSSR
ncbi:cell division protein FtsI (penicillin-binding protein 3) [Phycicoccus badiiscoriae]|uniref:Cell division protein FtsI (Penicillin-binding protein 3) n=1 Tax=Pedococcus badiiscoriae TaxID=642776 RepID=A0A852WAP2_9MICO|nr:penicillin-binding protein 2 [Pedococcus badiiscoriae]NYG05690.1 cell division protein FtsI (penicillin-binding protein 3) [Pedococcus badiiscoriae]